jgi:hypothetical protein
MIGVRERSNFRRSKFREFLHDQHDMLRLLQRYEGQQREATLIETFPLAMRKADFPF